MSETQTRIQEEARKLLESGEVALVIGWGAGSTPFKTTPVFIERPEDADKLVWRPACVNNLSIYLPKLSEDRRVAIVAKPCDVRSLVTLIQERQVKRENVFIIGLSCAGVVDVANLDDLDVDLGSITGLEWTDSGAVRVDTSSGSVEVGADSLRQMCALCTKRTPALADVVVGEEPSPVESSAAPELPEDRAQYWAEQFSKCVRCYACRQVCPNCYCESCFADRIEPKWTAKKPTGEEAWMFHATRAMHLAGRCISCGECERVCPVGIPVARLFREMSDAVEERYGYEAGNPAEEAPLLGAYRDEDYDPAHHSE